MTDTVVAQLVRSRTKQKTAKVFVRMPAALERVIAEAATMHGRSFSDEIRRALEVHAARSVLGVMPDPEIQERLGSGADEYAKKLKADIRALEGEAYARPTRAGILTPYEPDD